MSSEENSSQQKTSARKNGKKQRRIYSDVISLCDSARLGWGLKEEIIKMIGEYGIDDVRTALSQAPSNVDGLIESGGWWNIWMDRICNIDRKGRVRENIKKVSDEGLEILEKIPDMLKEKAKRSKPMSRENKIFLWKMGTIAGLFLAFWITKDIIYDNTAGRFVRYMGENPSLRRTVESLYEFATQKSDEELRKEYENYLTAYQSVAALGKPDSPPESFEEFKKSYELRGERFTDTWIEGNMYDYLCRQIKDKKDFYGWLKRKGYITEFEYRSYIRTRLDEEISFPLRAGEKHTDVFKKYFSEREM